ncbi:MAG: serine hydrolase domain-containing protein [Pseudomonadota bacterium]
MKFFILLLSYTLISMNAVAEDVNSEQLFSWAESKCPTYFPSIGATTGTFEIYQYKYYPKTDSYLASSGEQVFYYRPKFGSEITSLGLIKDYVSLAECPAYSDSNTVSDELAQKLDNALKTAVENNKGIGAVMVVKTEDGSVWKGATGYSVYEDKTAMTTDLHFRIGSITKTFTSTLSLILVDAGKLSLDATVNSIVPELGIVMGDIITVENLLEMRSGLSKYLANLDFYNTYVLGNPGYVFSNPEDVIAYSNIKYSDPDAEFLYNNGNYMILGLIIEKITGMSYADALSQHILQPLNLKHTFVANDLNMPVPFAYGYNYDKVYDTDGNPSYMLLNHTFYLNPPMAWSAGGMISNLDDLLIWSKAYNNGSLLSDESHAKQFSQQVVTDNDGINSYGLGTMTYAQTYGETKIEILGHDGYLPPYGSWVARYGNSDIVLLMNGTGDLGSEQANAYAPLVASYVLTEIIDLVKDDL